MRPFPHEIDEDVLEEHFHAKRVHYTSRLAKARMAEAKKDFEFFSDRHAEARQLAAMAHILESESDAVRKWLLAASRDATTAVELGLLPGCYPHMIYLSLAVLAPHETLRSALVELSPVPQKTTPAVFLHTAETLRQLAGRRPEASETLGQAETALTAATAEAREVMEPYILMMRAILEADAHRFAEAVQASVLEAERAFDTTIRVDADGFVDFIGLALIQLASERGLETKLTTAAAFLPLDLLPG